MELEYQGDRPSNQEIKEKLEGMDLGDFRVQPTGEKGIILRMKDISEETHLEIAEKLESAEGTKELRFQSIGPTIGRELKSKTKIVVVFSLLAIVLYIAIAFRKLSFPAKSWQYGIASLIALFHDILVPLGVLAVLGEYYGVQITIPVIVALLTVVGYSINNTVVVFDRIRDNLFGRRNEGYEETLNSSLNQTLTRSINTSLTTLFVLTAIFFFGGETLKYFALTLIIGIIAGTYSSLFLAAPILFVWISLRRKGL